MRIESSRLVVSRRSCLQTSRLCLAIASIAACLAAPGTAVAQNQEPSFTRGWHVVRPGETLIGIATSYLGDPQQWQRLHKLNPEIKNPHSLTPGSRIRVQLDFSATVATAQISEISGHVEARPTPAPWDLAVREELLRDDDGARTYQRSSAEMSFQDGTRMVLTEDSLVFFRSGDIPGGAPRPKARNQQVEIVEGQADLSSVGSVQAVDVEVFVGGARALPEADAAGKVAARARQDSTGGASFMVFNGSSEVEASGETVAVAEGMGTVVPESGPPQPPEMLLPAPTTVLPEPAMTFEFSNPFFRWDTVADAASYVVDVCRDARCTQLVQHVPGLTETYWTPERLPVGKLYWRVAAVSDSGLDGYPSGEQTIEILSEEPDTASPVGRAAVVGPQFRVGNELFVDETVSFDVGFDDAQSGVQHWQTTISDEVIADPASPGEIAEGPHVLVANANDWAGNHGDVERLSFTVDTLAPEIRWKVTERDVVGQIGDPVVDLRNVDKKHERWIDEKLSWLEWSDSGRRWIPLGWGDDRTSRVWLSLQKNGVAPASNGIYNEWKIPADSSQLILIAPGIAPFSGPDVPQLDPSKLLLIQVEDLGVGVDSMTLRTRDATDRPGFTFEIEATDFLGHTATVSWPLAGQTHKERKLLRKASK